MARPVKTEFRTVDEVYNPALESTAALATLIGRHTLEKGFQSGSLFGALVAVPVAAWLYGKQDASSITEVMAYSALGFTGATGVAGLVKFSNIDRQGFEDRAIRLRANNGQHRVDTMSLIGSLAGALGAAYYFKQNNLPLSALNVVGGAAVGSAAGVTLHTLTTGFREEALERAVEGRPGQPWR